MPTFITLYDGMKYAVRILFDARYIQAKTEKQQKRSAFIIERIPDNYI